MKDTEQELLSRLADAHQAAYDKVAKKTMLD